MIFFCLQFSTSSFFSSKLRLNIKGTMSGIQNIAIQELEMSFKTWLYAPKCEWEQVLLKDLPPKISKVPKVHLQLGRDAIYVIPILKDATGQKLYWIILDIEVKDHDKIEANIEAAQEFLMWLSEKGLTEHLRIMLTGRGFRFLWPMLVPPEYMKGFFRWIRDSDFPFIDGAPQLRGTHIRLLGYRGNSRQGSPPKNVHVHLLPSITKLMDLTKVSYRRIVRGRLPADLYMEWLPALLPNQFITDEWIELFEYYRRKARLESSIVQISLKYSRFQQPKLTQVWDQIDTYLAAQGIEKREIQVGDQIIVKLSECPMCKRRDGGPHLTSTGTLKDFHANSCPAGEFYQDGEWCGRIKGLPPFKWVEGYIGAIEGHSTTHPNRRSKHHKRGQDRHPGGCRGRL